MNDDLSTLLLLADGRFPSGGHAHSGGFEPVAALEGLADVDALERVPPRTPVHRRRRRRGVRCRRVRQAGRRTRRAELRARRPHTVPRAAGSVAPPRTPGLAGRPHDLAPSRPRCRRVVRPRNSPADRVRRGAAAAGLGPYAAALAAAHDAAIGPATAAVRLLGLDPFAVHAAVARLAPDIADVAERGAAHADTPPADMPASCAPLLDIAAEVHATWEVRLFAS